MISQSIAILTDSTCDIPESMQAAYSIYVQPHVLIWKGQEYRDRIDITPEAFYERLGKEAELPTTSQATVADFLQTYRRICDDGAKEIVAVLVNSGFSGAIQSARTAAESAPVPVTVHDSHGATMSLGFQVIAAARAREAGGAAAMVAAAEAVRKRVRLLIALDTLEYVYRGGRIGNAGRLLGKALNIKPMITIDHEKGIVEPAGMAMTRRKSIDQMYSTFFQQIAAQPGRGKGLHVAVLHGDAAQEAKMLYERVQADYAPEELLLNITCPTLGINTGPRAIALCGYQE